MIIDFGEDDEEGTIFALKDWGYPPSLRTPEGSIDVSYFDWG